MEDRIDALERANKRLSWSMAGLLCVMFVYLIFQSLGPGTNDCRSLTVRGGGIRVVDDASHSVAYLGPDGSGYGRLALQNTSVMCDLATLGFNGGGARLQLMSLVAPGGTVASLGASRKTQNGELELTGIDAGFDVKMSTSDEAGPFIEVRADTGTAATIPLLSASR